MAEGDSPPTLYEWAGGHDGLERLINAFYDRVERDELLSPLFGGGVGEEHRRNVVAWWSEVFEHAPVPRWGWGEAPPFQP